MKEKDSREGGNSNQIPQTDNLAQFFGRKSFSERIEPVLEHLAKILCPDIQIGQPLPAYCHRILQIFRRTYLKNFPSFTDIAPGRDVNWRPLGRMIGVALRCLRFGECETDQVLNLTPGQEKEIAQLLVIQPEVDVTFWNNCVTRVESAFAEWNQRAFQFSPTAFADLSAGISEGMRGFMDESGGFTGESNRAGMYWFLLLARPEISQMQRACPPVTRTDFAAWLEPFARAGIVGSADLDQIREVCKDIGLKFKKPGAPRKRKIIGECRKF